MELKLGLQLVQMIQVKNKENKMALKNTIILDGGVELKESYVKISEISFNELAPSKIVFKLVAYKDKESRDESVSNTLNLKLEESIDENDLVYTKKIAPLIDKLKTELYLWSKDNSYASFSDI